MTPHRPPEGIPVHLLELADRLALAEHADDEWQKAYGEASRTAIHSPDATLIREVGLTSSALRPGRKLGEHSLGDDRLGHEVLLELALRRRGQ